MRPLLPALVLAAAPLGCDTAVSTYERPPPAVQAASCGASGGVEVAGTVRFDGEVPATAKLWLSFAPPGGSIPPCSMEAEAAAFPFEFSFDTVPTDQEWQLSVVLDADGGFPPVAEPGDWVAGPLPIADAQTSLELSLQPFGDPPVMNESGLCGVEEEIPVVGADCGAADGVTVAGVAFYDGELPPTARGYFSWSPGPDEIPPCFASILPLRFPIAYRFTGVPDEPWALQSYVDLDGAFPPVPTAGDPIARLEADELDLTGDVDELCLTLEGP